MNKFILTGGHPHSGDVCEIAKKDDKLATVIKQFGRTMYLVNLDACAHGGIDKVYAERDQLKQIVF